MLAVYEDLSQLYFLEANISRHMTDNLQVLSNKIKKHFYI